MTPRLACLIALALLCVACAQLGSPQGGEPDTTGPILVEAEPAHKSTNVDSRQLVLRFDEFLGTNLNAQSIFISPRPAQQPEVYAQNKKLIINFQEELLPNTTYVITLGKGVTDFNARNPIRPAIQYAFSTGPVLDTATVSGYVLDVRTGLRVQDQLVALYPVDSLPDGHPLNKAPLYLAPVDSNGAFTFEYLKPGQYYAFSFADEDNTYTWSSLKEPLGWPKDPVISVQYEDVGTPIILYQSIPDTTSPRVLKISYLNRSTLGLTLTEFPYKGSYTTPDSTFSWSEPTGAPWVRNEEYFLALPWNSPTGDSLPYTLALTDSAGNRTDTTLTAGIDTSRASRFFDLSPVPTPDDQELYALYFQLTAAVPYDSLLAHTHVLDTTGTTVPFTLEMRSPYTFTLRYPDTLRPEMPYSLEFDSLLATPTGLLLGETLAYRIPFPKFDDFGSLKGRIVTERDDLIYLLFTKDGKKRYLRRGTSIDFPYLEAETYYLLVIEDLDGNGLWTPGRIGPLQLPEPTHLYSQPIVVRKGWAIEEQDYTYPPTSEEATAAFQLNRADRFTAPLQVQQQEGTTRRQARPTGQSGTSPSGN